MPRVGQRGDITTVQQEGVFSVRKRSLFGQDRSCFNFQHRRVIRVKLQRTSPDCLIGWKLTLQSFPHRQCMHGAVRNITFARDGTSHLTTRAVKGPCPWPSCGKPHLKMEKTGRKNERILRKYF